MSRSNALKGEWEQLASVTQVTLSSDIPGKEIKAPTDFRRAKATEEDLKATYVISVDENFVQTYDMQLLAGRFFEKDRPADWERLVLNEKAIELLGYTSAEEALNQRAYVFLGGNIQGFEGEIIGVLANHHQRSLNNDYDPILMFYSEERSTNYYALKVSTNDANSMINQVEALYVDFFPDNPIEHFFLDDFFNQQYQADQRYGQIFSLFALLAIFIACLGLFGLATYTAKHRVKEIGIRKVLGASVPSLVVLLSRDFIRLVLIASLVALPLAYLALQEWLASYAFRIDIGWWLLLLPVGIVLLIALLTVSFQTIRAALANPVDSLRYE